MAAYNRDEFIKVKFLLNRLMNIFTAPAAGWRIVGHIEKPQWDGGLGEGTCSAVT